MRWNFSNTTMPIFLLFFHKIDVASGGKPTKFAAWMMACAAAILAPSWKSSHCLFWNGQKRKSRIPAVRRRWLVSTQQSHYTLTSFCFIFFSLALFDFLCKCESKNNNPSKQTPYLEAIRFVEPSFRPGSKLGYFWPVWNAGWLTRWPKNQILMFVCFLFCFVFFGGGGLFVCFLFLFFFFRTRPDGVMYVSLWKTPPPYPFRDQVWKCWGNTRCLGRPHISWFHFQNNFTSWTRLVRRGTFVCSTQELLEKLWWGVRRLSSLTSQRTDLSPPPRHVEPTGHFNRFWHGGARMEVGADVNVMLMARPWHEWTGSRL